jgi:hypothetical protein
LAEVTSFMNSCECCIKDIFWFSSPWELIFELNLAALSGPLVDVKRGVYGREELSYGMRAPPIDRLSQRINLGSPFIDAHKASLPVECEQLQKTGSEVFIRQFCSEFEPELILCQWMRINEILHWTVELAENGGLGASRCESGEPSQLARP